MKKRPKIEINSTVNGSDELLLTSFEAILNRIKEAYGAANDTEVSKNLDVQRQSVGAAKRRGVIPPGWILQTAEATGYSADWLQYGKGPKKRDEYEASTTVDMELAEEGGGYEPHGGWRPPLQGGDYKLLGKTYEILRSDTVYRTALTSNINAFHKALTTEALIDQQAKKIEAQAAEIEQLKKDQVALLERIEALEKKRTGTDD